MSRTKAIIDKLNLAQERFLRAADAVAAEKWKVSPGNGSWSAGELVAHLVAAERRVLGAMGKMLQEPPRSIPFHKRFHVPLAIVEVRLIRRKSPMPVQPESVFEKEASLAELRRARAETLALVEKTQARDLSAYRWPHPFLGNLGFYSWIEFLGAHEIRHAKQMQEIANRLPKVVGNLQK